MRPARSDNGKILLVGSYRGDHRRWAVGRAMDGKHPGPYMIGAFVADGGVVFYGEKLFTSRENAEAHLLYRVDQSARL